MNDMTFMAALESALKIKANIGRRCWGGALVGIEDKHTPFIAMPNYEIENARRLNWNPTPDDFLANDWYVAME